MSWRGFVPLKGLKKEPIGASDPAGAELLLPCGQKNPGEHARHLLALSIQPPGAKVPGGQTVGAWPGDCDT